MLRSVFSPSLPHIASSNCTSTSVCSSRCPQLSVNGLLCTPYSINVLHFYDYYDRATVCHGALWGYTRVQRGLCSGSFEDAVQVRKPSLRRLLVRPVLQVIEARAELQICETGNACECVCVYSVAERKRQRQQERSGSHLEHCSLAAPNS